MEYGLFILIVLIAFALDVLILIMRNVFAKVFLMLIVGFIAVTFLFDNTITQYYVSPTTGNIITNTFTQPFYPYIPMLLIILAIIGFVKSFYYY
jgi:hypothetical protein